MNDITALIATMKAAAEKATPGRIGDRIDGSGSIKYQCFGNDGSLVLQTDHKNMRYGFIGPNSRADELFFRMCSPENIKSLVEALEAGDTANEQMAREIISRNGEIEGLRQYVTELENKLSLYSMSPGEAGQRACESRTVTVKSDDADEVREEGNQFLVVRHPGKVPVIKHPVGQLEDYLLHILKADPLATIDIVTHRYYGVGGQFVEDADEYLHEMDIKWEAE